jgi:hypothetical protein
VATVFGKISVVNGGTSLPDWYGPAYIPHQSERNTIKLLVDDAVMTNVTDNERSSSR